jgi:hypothetical protein
LRIYAQQLSRQFFGLWRSRDATLQRPPALPLIGRRYHTPLNPRNKSLLANLSRSQSGPQNDEHGWDRLFPASQWARTALLHVACLLGPI